MLGSYEGAMVEAAAGPVRPGPCGECRELCPETGGGCSCVEPEDVCGCPYRSRVTRTVDCPGLGCGYTARRWPDGRTVCDETGWVYGPDGAPLRDPDPDLGGVARAAGWS